MTCRLIHLDEVLVHHHIPRSDWEMTLGKDPRIRYVFESGDVVLIYAPDSTDPDDVELHVPDETSDEGIVDAVRRAALAVGLFDRQTPEGGAVPGWANWTSKWDHDDADGSFARVHRWTDGRVSVELLEVIDADGTRRVQDVELDPGEGNDRLERRGDLSGYAASLRAAADVLDVIGGDLR
ncbi:hypothetical protein [Jiangella mangrovi]|uniref:Uncharacterized protein n=1 Tax=Jiangella mangrovi TaxID=1524084 RepID=A0A7W9GLC1_9ACTN|nr:hypothetical protein [Jiangella mangrovi]MBB5786002.1 hypothetical protein [Jiangella mangrovi]